MLQWETKKASKKKIPVKHTRGLDGLHILLNDGDRGADRRVDGGVEDGGVLRRGSLLLLLLLDINVGYKREGRGWC